MLDAVPTALVHAIGQRVELVLVENPFAAKPEVKLAVRALFEGKSLVVVEISDGVTEIKEENIPRYQTDARDIAHVPISKRGW